MIRYKRFFRILLFISLINGLILKADLGMAQQVDRVTVRMDGRALFRVGPLDELDPRERADQIERRLMNLLENPEAIAPAQIEADQSDLTRRVISVAGVPVVTVTEADAQDNLTDINTLAVQWKQAIDQVLQRGAERRLSLLADGL